MNERVYELIQREIDEMNSPEEQRELEEALAVDEDAAAYLNELQAAVDMFSEVPPVQPPPGLKRRIMSALPADRYAPRPAPLWQRGLAGVSNFLQKRQRLAYGYSFVLGALATLVVVGLATRVGPADEGQALGTLISRDALTGLSPLEAVTVKLDGVKGSVTVRAEDGRAVVEIGVTSIEPVDLQLNFDETLTPLRGWSRVVGDGGSAIAVDSGTIRFEHSRAHSYLIVFDVLQSYNADVEMKIAAGEEVEQLETLRLVDSPTSE